MVNMAGMGSSNNERPTRAHERAAWEAGHVTVAGVDEAGRGPLAGPVVAAAVVLPPEIEIWGLADSKQLLPEEREALYPVVMECAVAVAVAAVEPEQIDRVNILCATHEAMACALRGLPALPDLALVDGLPARGLPCPHRAVVKGDCCCVSIAAASIIAKVERDRLMVELDARYPGYGFARHKGYPTPAHREALRLLGPCPAHRRTFRPVAECLSAEEFEFGKRKSKGKRQRAKGKSERPDSSRSDTATFDFCPLPFDF